jgi:hypothetical protein
MFKKITTSRTMVAALLGTALIAQPVLSQRVFAAGGDFSSDFTAAAPLTYNHVTGGGAYDDRTVGRDLDIVESLEGGDFACENLVTFLTQIRVSAGAFNGAQIIELNYRWLADSTGQSGVALDELHNVQINYGAVSGGDGPGGTDSGITDDGGSVASIVAQDLTDPLFSKGAKRTGTIRVTDLEPGENVVLRFDLRIKCNGQIPTGNLQAWLDGARVVAPIGQASSIRVGNQTIPFKNVDDIKCTDPKECPPCTDPKECEPVVL